MTTTVISTWCVRQLRVLFLASLAVVAVSQAQIQSITASFGYSAGGKSRLNVQRISGYGGKVRLSLHVYDHVTIGLNAGYASYSIDQADQLTNWNWNFWNERYYLKIQSDLRADPSLSVAIGSEQSMDALPALITVEYNHVLSDNLALIPSIGGGVVFYTRKLYVDETWTKVFPAAKYSFTYSFRNFAPDKKGNISLIDAGCDIRYQMFTDVSLQAGARYTHYNPFNSGSGYGEFPLTNEFTILVGLTFEY